MLASLKAVDPAHYPYYGEVKLEPECRSTDALTPDTVVAGEDLLIRLGLKVGDKVQRRRARIFGRRRRSSPSRTACRQA